MSNPTPVTPHIDGTVSLPSTGFGSPALLAQANAVDFGTRPVRSSGLITHAEARQAQANAANRLRSNARKVLVVG